MIGGKVIKSSRFHESTHQSFPLPTHGNRMNPRRCGNPSIFPQHCAILHPLATHSHHPAYRQWAIACTRARAHTRTRTHVIRACVSSRRRCVLPMLSSSSSGGPDADALRHATLRKSIGHRRAYYRAALRRMRLAVNTV